MTDYNFFKLFNDQVPGAWNSFEFDDRYEIHVDLPGVKKEDIEINLSHDTISVKAKRNQPEGKRIYKETNYGEITKTGILKGITIDREKMEASLNNGVLVVVFPKGEDSIPKKIEIK